MKRIVLHVCNDPSEVLVNNGLLLTVLLMQFIFSCINQSTDEELNQVDQMILNSFNCSMPTRILLLAGGVYKWWMYY